MIDDPLRKAFEAAAEHLTGKNILVMFQPPTHSKGLGEAYNSDKGFIAIDIHPKLDLGRAVWVGLHEVAHIKLGHLEALPKVSREVLKAWGDSTSSTEPTEDAAGALADKWISWAKEFIKNSVSWRTTDYRKALAILEALKFYK